MKGDVDLQNIRNSIERKKGRKMQIESSLKQVKRKIKIDSRYLHDLEKAREILRIVGLETQRKIQFHISDIASLALEGIFPEPYKLVLDFVERRNKTECDILFERNGKTIKPLDASGVGAVDVASFALRIALWSMSMPKPDNVIILDEPMRFLSENFQEDASRMIKEISDKLGIQFIIITHEPILGTYADKVFEVKQSRGVSKIKEK
jgi:chromosome segregation ATPase